MSQKWGQFAGELKEATKALLKKHGLADGADVVGSLFMDGNDNVVVNMSVHAVETAAAPAATAPLQLEERREVSAGRPLTLRQRILQTLARNHEMKIAELAEKVGGSQGRFSNMLHDLEARGDISINENEKSCKFLRA